MPPADFRPVNVAADHAVDILTRRFTRHGFLEVADVLHRVLHLVLEKCGQRPVGKTELAPYVVDAEVGAQQIVVEASADTGKQRRAFDYTVERIAMQNEQLAL